MRVRSRASCRLDPASLLAASSAQVRRTIARPASWPEQKRQQAAALQSDSLPALLPVGASAVTGAPEPTSFLLTSEKR
jgi:hypothetical protein